MHDGCRARVGPPVREGNRASEYVRRKKLSNLVGSTLILYTWIVAAILVFFFFLIGRFYEIRFKQDSGYRLWFIPLALFLGAAVWDVWVNTHTGNPLLDFVGEPGPDALLLAGGAVLTALGYSLYRTMMGGR